MGDPAGIGPEVVLKAASSIMHRSDPPMIVVLGDLEIMRAAASRLKGDLAVPRESGRGTRLKRSASTLAVINVGKLPPSAGIPGTPAVEGAEAAYRYVIEAARLTMKGDADALVTAPINKEWLNRAGHHFPGHSELLAELAHTPLWRMMFAGEQLRLALVTVHMGLAKVSRMLTRDGVFETIRLLAEHLCDQLG